MENSVTDESIWNSSAKIMNQDDCEESAYHSLAEWCRRVITSDGIFSSHRTIIVGYVLGSKRPWYEMSCTLFFLQNPFFPSIRYCSWDNVDSSLISSFRDCGQSTVGCPSTDQCIATAGVFFVNVLFRISTKLAWEKYQITVKINIKW